MDGCFPFSIYDPYGGAKTAHQLAYYAMVIVTLLTIATSFFIKKASSVWG